MKAKEDRGKEGGGQPSDGHEVLSLVSRGSRQKHCVRSALLYSVSLAARLRGDLSLSCSAWAYISTPAMLAENVLGLMH